MLAGTRSQAVCLGLGVLPCKIRFRMPRKLSHYDSAGRATMVDISAKLPSQRRAAATAFVSLKPAVLKALPKNPKGDPLEVARLAGIMAAKRTHELIPLCHQLPLEVVSVDFSPNRKKSILEIEGRAVTQARTGVEMEALVAVSTAALVIYDMAKAIDRAMEIGAIRLVAKRGGRSGEFTRPRESLWPSR